MTLEVVWTKYTHEFTLIALLLPGKSPWNSADMGSEFTLISLLLPGKSLWNSVDMRNMTLEVV